MRRLSRVQNNLLTLGAILGALCLLAAIVAVLIGAKPLVFRSGSMAPAIPTGALGISIPVEAAALRAGDVISVETAAGVRITHRLVQADVSGDTATVTLKGDANSIPDAEPYVLRTTERVIAHAPLLGYAVAWLSSSAAVFAGGLFTAYLFYLAFGAPKRRGSRLEPPQPESRPQGGRRARRSGRRATRLTAMSLVSLGVLTGGALHTAAPSQAAFTDGALATGQFTATQLPSPTLVCIQDGNNIRLRLTRSGSLATDYALVTLVPNESWSSGLWPGTTVTVTIDADDNAFDGYRQERAIQFQAAQWLHSWVSTPASSLTVQYTPKALLGLVPASLDCP
ncbi:signal peptidase I [Arthrobacter pascens]|uniref:signal peptidase I n=1 Tax=Arthrobacter pascens TaxID=1677 RepID=UPI002790D940|nr:signal peptidase I [Arthrobacter pascens]MDQ0677542.1 signal peptidase I [Arthrobacter pascens]